MTILRTLAITAALTLCAATPSPGQSKTPIRPKGHAVGGPYTPGILSGGTLYVAGQVGRAGSGKYPEAFADEVKQTLENVGVILKEAGFTFADAVNVQVYLTDMKLFDQMNKVYMTYFPEPRPARTTVGVAALVGPARIEITVQAAKKKSDQ